MRKFILLFLLAASAMTLSAQEYLISYVYPQTGYLTEGSSDVIYVDSDLEFIYLIFEWDEGMELQFYYTDFLGEEEFGPYPLNREEAIEMSIFLSMDLRVESVEGEGNWYLYAISNEEAQEVGYYFEEY